MTVRTPPSFLQNITLVANGHTAQNDRLTQGALWTPSRTAVQSRSGIAPAVAGGRGEVTVLSNTSVRVNAFRAVIQGTRAAAQGQYTVVNDSAVDLSIGAQASGVSRIDTLMVNVCDTAFAPDTLDTARIIVVPGTAASSNPQPPTLGGANLGNFLVLGQLNVPATGGTVTFTPASELSAVALGGIRPLLSGDPTGNAGAYDGEYRTHPTLGLQQWVAATGTWVAADVVPINDTLTFLNGIYGPISETEFATARVKRVGTKRMKLQGAFTHVTGTFQADAGTVYDALALPSGTAPFRTQQYVCSVYTGNAQSWITIFLRGNGNVGYLSPVALSTGMSISLNGIEWEIGA